MATDLPRSVSDDEPDVTEALLLALLHCAAKKDAHGTWERARAPDGDDEDGTRIEVQREDDGALGVFRFFDLVESDDDVTAPLFELSLPQARLRGVDTADLEVGDEVGLELPLPRLLAIARADVRAARAGNAVVLPARIGEMLSDPARAHAVLAALSPAGPDPHATNTMSLRSPAFGLPANSPTLAEPEPPALLALFSRADRRADVDWVTLVVEPESGEPVEVVAQIARGGQRSLVVCGAAGSAADVTRALCAVAPPPPPGSLWRALEAELPALLCGESDGELWSRDRAGRRCALQVRSVRIETDPDRYGDVVVSARVRVLTGSTIDRDETGDVTLPSDVPRLLLAHVGDERERARAWRDVVACAARFRAQLVQRLDAIAEHLNAGDGDDATPLPDVALAGCSVVRALARAALGHALSTHKALPVLPVEVQGGDDTTITLSLPPLLPDVHVVLSPGEDTVALRTARGLVTVLADGVVADGDVGAFRAWCDAVAQGLIDGDTDVELAFPGDEESEDLDSSGEGEVVTALLSTWLLDLASDAQAADAGWAGDGDAALALCRVIDATVDVPLEALARPRGDDDGAGEQPL